MKFRWEGKAIRGRALLDFAVAEDDGGIILSLLRVPRVDHVEMVLRDLDQVIDGARAKVMVPFSFEVDRGTSVHVGEGHGIAFKMPNGSLGLTTGEPPSPSASSESMNVCRQVFVALRRTSKALTLRVAGQALNFPINAAVSEALKAIHSTPKEFAKTQSAIAISEVLEIPTRRAKKKRVSATKKKRFRHEKAHGNATRGEEEDEAGEGAEEGRHEAREALSSPSTVQVRTSMISWPFVAWTTVAVSSGFWRSR